MAECDELGVGGGVHIPGTMIRRGFRVTVFNDPPGVKWEAGRWIEKTGYRHAVCGCVGFTVESGRNCEGRWL